MKKSIWFIIAIPLFMNAVQSTSITIPVTKSTPIYRDVVTQTPRTECKDEDVRAEVSCGDSYDDTNSLGLDTLLGVAAGVALGNQIGKDRTKDVARVIGGIGGGIVANKMRDNSQTCYTTRRQERCTTRYDERITREMVGYELCGKIESQEICTESANKRDTINLFISAR